MILVFNRCSILTVLKEKWIELGFVVGEVEMKREDAKVDFNVGQNHCRKAHEIIS